MFGPKRLKDYLKELEGPRESKERKERKEPKKPKKFKELRELKDPKEYALIEELSELFQPPLKRRRRIVEAKKEEEEKEDVKFVRQRLRVFPRTDIVSSSLCGM